MSFENISLSTSVYLPVYICHSLGRRKLQTSAVKTCIFWYLPTEHDISNSRSYKDKMKRVVTVVVSDKDEISRPNQSAPGRICLTRPGKAGTSNRNKNNHGRKETCLANSSKIY